MVGSFKGGKRKEEEQREELRSYRKGGKEREIKTERN